MGSKFWPRWGSPGTLHHFTETLVTFEFSSNNARQPHSILFVGGLGDGLATTSYVADVVRGLQSTEWSLFTLNLTSALNSWGFSHLDRDTDEIAKCIQYIKEYKERRFGPGGKLVLMGHSTGSQSVLHYLSRPNPHTSTPAFDPDLEHVLRPALDGAIMQAPVSDREASKLVVSEGFLGRTPSELRKVYDQLVKMAKDPERQDGPWDTMLPLSLTSQLGYRNYPVSARRFLSLVSPDSPQFPSEDDMFSSDLGDEQLAQTFGMIGERGLLKQKLLVLMSGADQAVPSWVDKDKLLARWKAATNQNGAARIWDDRSGQIPGASHALSNDDQAEPRKFLVSKVLAYLADVEKIA
ncbi:hypothetical protein VTK26DRAFT_4744 [Humicola hyalothermophila]